MSQPDDPRSGGGTVNDWIRHVARDRPMNVDDVFRPQPASDGNPADANRAFNALIRAGAGRQVDEPAPAPAPVIDLDGRRRLIAVLEEAAETDPEAATTLASLRASMPAPMDVGLGARGTPVGVVRHVTGNQLVREAIRRAQLGEGAVDIGTLEREFQTGQWRPR